MGGADLKVVIIRHGEKLEDLNIDPQFLENLSCQGMNRALQLPKVLFEKFGKPEFTYVPKLKCGPSTEHSRMFQTVAPFAIKYQLAINSSFAEADVANAAADVLTKSGTILIVWEHTQISPLAKELHVAAPPDWHGKDFDSIWIITYPDGITNEAKLDFDKEGITPGAGCPY